MDGILLLDKPEGVTSAAVVREVKGALRCKVGHLGTLDPFASGLLPLCLGEGTKIAQFLNTADKVYEGAIRLGWRTDTGDRTGTTVEEQALPSPLSAQRCGEVAASFLGERLQVPPMYSALKRDGVPLYKLARQGVDVERKPRPVLIEALTLEPLEGGRIGIRVHCSKGTYVRVLAEEVAVALGTVGHLESLRRTRFGHFDIGASVCLPLAMDTAAAALIPPRQALEELDEVWVDSAVASRVRRGQVAVLRDLGKPTTRNAAVKLVGPDGSLLAVVAPDAAGMWQFARVMA